MSDRPVIPDSRPLNWNAGGWFGAQTGGTCWIAICAALLSAHHLTIAAVVFGLFMGANVIGAVLWGLRDRISAYMGMNILIIVVGAVSLVGVLVIDGSGLWHVVEGYGGKVSAGQMYVLIIALIFGLLALFWSINRSRSEIA